MIQKIHSSLFYAHSLNKTASFYKKLGFPIQSSKDAVRIQLGGFTLTFIDENTTQIKNESGAQPKGLGVFTYIKVDKVDEYYKFLQKQKIPTSSEPRDWPWGKREFIVKDPDGYKLVFYSPI